MRALAMTTRQAMALLALLFGIVAGGGAPAFAAEHDRAAVAALLTAEFGDERLERSFDPATDRLSPNCDGDAAALAGLPCRAEAARATAFPASFISTPPRRQAAAQANRARAPPLA